MSVNRGSAATRTKPRPPLRSQLREAARAAILDAAEELIAVRGIESTSLAQIAEQAGVAVGTLYNYFTDRDALIKALFEVRRATIRPLLRAAGSAAEGQPFDARLRAFIVDTFTAFQQYRKFFKIAVECEYSRVSPSSTPQDLLASAAAVVDAGIAERIVDGAHRKMLPAMIVGAMKAVVIGHLGDDRDFVEDAEPLATLLLDGIRKPTRSAR